MKSWLFVERKLILLNYFFVAGMPDAEMLDAGAGCRMPGMSKTPFTCKTVGFPWTPWNVEYVEALPGRRGSKNVQNLDIMS